MKTKEEIERKLGNLTGEKKRAKRALTRCECCGQYPPIMGTFVLGDDARIEGKISTLEWVLKDSQIIEEDEENVL